MKRLVTILAVVLFAGGMAQGAYTYTYGPGTNFGSKTLVNSESMLVNGGGGGLLTLTSTSYARIESTTLLGSDYGGGVWAGGIWRIEAASSSYLEVLGGEIGKLYVGDYAHTWLYGGRIENLQSGQLAPQIDLFCKSHSFNAGTGMLTGIWGNDSTFSIRLTNSPNPLHTPTYDNITFHIIPEPASLALFGVGGAIWAGYKRRLG